MTPDRRVARTDRAIMGGFLRLLFSERYDAISMSRIAAEADVSRSTLYQRYPTKERLLEASMTHLLAVLADTAAEGEAAEKLDAVLAHFWANRRLAKAVFGPPVDGLVRRWLAAMIDRRLRERGAAPTSAALASVRLSAGTVGLLEAWLTGQVAADRASVAAVLSDVGRSPGEGAGG